MDSHVTNISGICKAQETFIEEVITVMHRTSIVSLYSASAILYKQKSLAMQQSLSIASNEFYNMMEQKYLDAQTRPPFIQRKILFEIELQMNKWIENMRSIQDSFSSMLNSFIQS